MTMDITKVFDREFKKMEDKGWDCIYVLVDIHGTIFKPSYNDEEKFEIYPHAVEALQLMKRTGKVKIILWSSSTGYWMNEYALALERNGVCVNYLNRNPDIKVKDNDPEQMDFSKKFYFNVGIDDKFGFEPDKDWEKLAHYFYKKEVIDLAEKNKSWTIEEWKKVHDFMKQYVKVKPKEENN